MPEAILQKIRSIPEAYQSEFSACVDDFLARISKKKRETAAPNLSQAEVMRLFERFTGSLKAPPDFDARKERLEYLDERYGV